jgi:hypothetical protein
MSDRSEHELPPELADVGELLRENRTRPSALELDAIKLQAKARVRSPRQLRRGVNVRSRGVTAVLTLLLLGGTTAGGIAGGGHDSGGGSASQAQYFPPRCTLDLRKCECPKGYSLGVVNGLIYCTLNPTPPPPPPHGGGGHGHHHHHNWRQGHNGHWQWCDGDSHNDRNWHDWDGRDNDW